MRAQEADAKSITIGYRTRDAAHADGPSGASYVFNDDGLAERGPHALGHNSPDRIRRPASRKRHNHRDRPRRVGLYLLRARRERPRGCSAEQRNEIAPFHRAILPVLPTGRIAHLGRPGDTAALRDFNSPYDWSGSPPVIRRCRLNVRFPTNDPTCADSGAQVFPPARARSRARGSSLMFDHPPAVAPPPSPGPAHYLVARDHRLSALRHIHLLMNVLHRDLLVSARSLALSPCVPRNLAKVAARHQKSPGATGVPGPTTVPVG